MKTETGRMLVIVLAVCAFAFVGVQPASAVPVDLELSLLVDVSGSVSQAEWELQRDGYVSAFNSASIVTAIQAGTIGSIAANYVYWSSAAEQQQTVGWTQISDAASATAFATAIAGAARPFGGSTAPGSAINFAVPLFTNGFEGTRLVIDVSGDGAQNSGASTSAARDAAALAGITINGIPILGEAGLEAWYNANIKTADGFVIPAADFTTFASAINTKLEAEIRDENPEIPEPASMMLLGTGLMGLVGLRKKRS